VLALGLTGRIRVCLQPHDGRKGIDGLAAVVTTHLDRDPLNGDLYVFRNRRRDRLKVLAWQGDGFALYLRRLERGTFAFPAADATEVAVTATELAMILGGIDLGSASDGLGQAPRPRPLGLPEACLDGTAGPPTQHGPE
jgi:transposase